MMVRAKDVIVVGILWWLFRRKGTSTVKLYNTCTNLDTGETIDVELGTPCPAGYAIVNDSAQLGDCGCGNCPGCA